MQHIDIDRYDERQKAVIRFNDGKALVLGAPGCGKTDILAVRVLMATREYGLRYDDMLCLTFTNRASRNMKDRIREVAGTDGINNLFIGNLHRFCIRFLYDNGIIPIDTCLIDDTDQEEIIRELVGGDHLRGYQVQAVYAFARYEYMVNNGFPSELIPDMGKTDAEMYAHRYVAYKQENRLIDFDDVLLLTYKALCEADYRQYKYTAYRWVQVDELQDLTPLQFAIIDKVIAPDFDSVVYLGDERQAIYSFLGARRQSIEKIRQEAGQNFYMLSSNYRSPMYLLDMMNDYAREVLGVDPKFLPTACNDMQTDDGLMAVASTAQGQPGVIAALVKDICRKGEAGESTGILVRTNNDAEVISTALTANGIAHTKITNKDIFKGLSFKLMHSHFTVVANETRYNDWTEILYRTRVLDKKTLAARFVKKVRSIGLLPTDFMDYDNSSYMLEFDKSYREREIVVFDTETTGLNVFEDDIIQIAAMKMRNGRPVPGSELDIIIETDKEIPPYLRKGLVNPMVEEYRRRKAGENGEHEYYLDARSALSLFAEYVGDAQLLGHNVNYDINILENNLRRRAPEVQWTTPTFWDTLKLSRLLDPDLRRHNLESLLEVHGLVGVNSHNAMDDIKATMALAQYCHGRMQPLLEQQVAFINHPEVKKVQQKMLVRYYLLYAHSRSLLYSPVVDEEHTFIHEFRYIYSEMLKLKYIEPINLFDYMCDLFDKVVMDREHEPRFNQQLSNHLYELRTFNEADLFQNGIITENVHVMTIHKAKGLEFDNVIIHNVSSGVYPHFRATDTMGDAKVLYVGLSRAKKRVMLTYNGRISPFIGQNQKVMEHFAEMKN